MEYRENRKGAIKNFTDLEVWKEGHKLVLLIYKLTKAFPKEEQFALTNQMRRCVVSITSNIAEGFSRRTGKDKTQFYTMAKGSLTELHSQTYVAKDLGYINDSDFKRCEEQITAVGRLLTGIIRATRTL